MPTVVHADALIDPRAGVALQGGVSLLVDGGRIVARGRRGELAAPADADRIDASGLTLLPGLIDCHVHLCFMGTSFDLGERLMTPASAKLLSAVATSAATLRSGFTTVRDAGGTPSGVRVAVERGYFPGPRMQLAIQILSQTGGHADPRFPCGVDLPLSSMLDLPESVVDGVDEMRRRVRELIRAGADWIKLCTSGGVLSPGDAPHHATFSLDEIRTAVEEATAQGRSVMAHAQATSGIKNALVGGVKTIEHGIWLDDEAISLMLEGDRTLVPTLVAPLWVIRHAEAGRMPAYAAEKGRSVVGDHKASIAQAITAGVQIAFGTDSGVGPHGSNNEEFRLMHELGLDHLACLRSATSVAADVLGLTGQVGSLDEGAFADLIAVEGNPLEDIEAVADPERIKLVVKGGAVVAERPR